MLDLAVIGGGPAGCATAILAALAGLKVVLVERLPFPRHRPGETLPPGAEPLFRQLGVWQDIVEANFIRHLGHRVSWADAVKAVQFGGPETEPWLGFQAWRPVLDVILLRRAAAVGVEVWQPCAALAPVVIKGRIAGLVTDRGQIDARQVVDATGGSGWLIRKLGGATRRLSPPLLASYGYTETEAAAQWYWPELHATPQGWTWMAQVLPHVVAWTRLSLHGQRVLQPPSNLRLPDARRQALGGAAADVTWRRASHPAGPGYFLVGDAALVLDPASAHGMLRALMSGIMAAHLIVQVAGDSISAANAGAAYTDWIRTWFEHDAEQLRNFYTQLADPPDWLFERRRVGFTF